MYSIYFDFKAVGLILTPNDCQKFESSKRTTIIIWTGASCDAVWSIVCLLLFYLRLRKLAKLMAVTQNIRPSIDRTEVSTVSTTVTTATTTTSKSSRKKGKEKTDAIHQFLPILVKLSILSFCCALSTLILGFTLWALYPTITSVIDSTINAFCVYLCFECNERLYKTLCMPLIACNKDWRKIIEEARDIAMSKIKSGSRNSAESTTQNIDTPYATPYATPVGKDNDNDNKSEQIDDMSQIKCKHHKHHISIQLDDIRVILHNGSSNPISETNQTVRRESDITPVTVQNGLSTTPISEHHGTHNQQDSEIP